jgi:hypothetical protein
VVRHGGRFGYCPQQVLDTLADSSKLAADERRTCSASLASPIPPPAWRQAAEQRVNSQLQQLINGMPDIPAMVLNRRTDLPAWNPAAVAPPASCLLTTAHSGPLAARRPITAGMPPTLD